MDYRKIVFSLVAAIVCSCASVRPVQPQIVYKDSVRVEYRDRIVRDTVKYTVDREVEKIVTRDTVSFLENAVAISEARVSGGSLFHSLESKAKQIFIPVEVHTTDTLYVEKQSEVITEYVKVQAELTFWQKSKLNLFWWLVVLVIAMTVWIFRKPILALVKTII